MSAHPVFVLLVCHRLEIHWPLVGVWVCNLSSLNRNCRLDCLFRLVVFLAVLCAGERHALRDPEDEFEVTRGQRLTAPDGLIAQSALTCRKQKFLQDEGRWPRLEERPVNLIL